MPSTRVLLQLDLFGGAAVRIVDVPGPPPAPPPPDVEPVVVLEGQLDLLQARSVRLEPANQALAAARWDEAVRLAAAPHEEILTGDLRHLVRRVAASPTEELTDAAFAPELERLASTAPAGLVAGVRRGLLVERALRLEKAGPGARAGGHGAAWWWREARRPAEVQRLVEGAVAAGTADAELLIVAGNVAFAGGEADVARRWWRRALWLPGAVEACALASEPEVAALVEDAPALGVVAGPGWLALVGEALGLLPAGPPEPSPPPEPARFQAALTRSRLASRNGRPDVEARRELRDLAPALFAAFRDDGRV